MAEQGKETSKSLIALHSLIVAAVTGGLSAVTSYAVDPAQVDFLTRRTLSVFIIGALGGVVMWLRQSPLKPEVGN
jgi:ABC-type branched-subunit amino acid transport system permease subunit